MLNPLHRTVANMMARFGGDAKLTISTGESTYDPATSSAALTVKQYCIRVIAEDYIQRASGITTSNGGLVKTGDKRFYVLAKPNTPMPRPEIDSILFGKDKWTVLTLKDCNPSGTDSYLYEVYARL